MLNYFSLNYYFYLLPIQSYIKTNFTCLNSLLLVDRNFYLGWECKYFLTEQMQNSLLSINEPSRFSLYIYISYFEIILGGIVKPPSVF